MSLAYIQQCTREAIVPVYSVRPYRWRAWAAVIIPYNTNVRSVNGKVDSANNLTCSKLNISINIFFSLYSLFYLVLQTTIIAATQFHINLL